MKAHPLSTFVNCMQVCGLDMPEVVTISTHRRHRSHPISATSRQRDVTKLCTRIQYGVPCFVTKGKGIFSFTQNHIHTSCNQVAIQRGARAWHLSYIHCTNKSVINAWNQYPTLAPSWIPPKLDHFINIYVNHRTKNHNNSNYNNNNLHHQPSLPKRT